MNSMTADATIRKFKVDDYYRMVDVGILAGDDRVELIEGTVIEMPPIGSHHAGIVDALQEILSARLGERARVRVQNPLRLSDESELAPDIALVEHRRYDSAHPGPADVFLVIEVSDCSLRFDLGTKVPMYALASIPEVWIVDITRAQIHVFRSPADGNFRDMHIARASEAVTPLKFPDVQIELGAVFN